MKEAYRGRKFRVELVDRVDRDGQSRPYEVIRHPGAAVIVPVLPDGRIVLIRNHRIAVGRELLELPAGTLDPGEAPQVCAARELAEETGYRCGEIRPLLKFYASPGICDETMHVFLATKLDEGRAALEPGEQIELAPTTLPDALAAIRDGRICDGKTVAGLLYYERFREAASSGGSTEARA